MTGRPSQLIISIRGKIKADMELFTAIRIKKHDADRLCAYADKVLDSAVEFAEDLHITLQYIGEQSDINGILCNLADVAYPPFSLKYGAFHAFSNMPACANVIWQGIIDEGNHLQGLYDLTAKALSDINYKNGRSYAPHITISYTKDSVNENKINSLVSPMIGQQFDVTAFELCEVLKDTCFPHFRTVAQFRLDESRSRKKAQLLWINDLHGAINETETEPGAAKLTAAIRNYVRQNPGTEVLFGGDNFFGDPISDMFKGAPIAEAMKAIHVKTSVIGNHDFDLTDEDLATCAEKGDFDFIAANLLSKHRYNFGSNVVMNINGFRIGVLGLVTKEPLPGPDHPECWNDYTIEDGAESAKHFIESSDYDAIAAATHYGLRETGCGGYIGEEALELLELPEGFDAIFTAHLHQVVRFSKGKTAVLQAGCKGRYFGVIRMTFSENRRLLSTIPLLYEVSRSIEPDPDIQSIVKTCTEKAMSRLNAHVGYASEDIPHRDADFRVPLYGTALTKIAADCMMKASGCDIALLYSGRTGFEGFRQGPVRLYDFKKQFPFKNFLVTLKLTGLQIKNILESGFRTPEEGLPSPIAVGGLTVIIDPEQKIGERIIRIMDKDGKDLKNEYSYQVVTENYLITDPFQIPLSQGKDIRYSDENLYDLVLALFQKNSSVKNEKPANIRIERR